MTDQQPQPAASSAPGQPPATNRAADLANFNEAIAELISVTTSMCHSDALLDSKPADPHARNDNQRTQETARIAKLEDRYDHEVKDRAACLKQIAHINRVVANLHERVTNLSNRLNNTQKILNARAKTNGNGTKSPLEQPYPG